MIQKLLKNAKPKKKYPIGENFTVICGMLLPATTGLILDQNPAMVEQLKECWGKNTPKLLN